MPARRRRVPVEPGGPRRAGGRGGARQRPGLPPHATVGHREGPGPVRPLRGLPGARAGGRRRSWRAPTGTCSPADATPWLTKRLQTFFEDRMTRAPEPVYLHKLTGWPRAGFLHAGFPDARFVNVVRDGRAVASSWLQMDWWLGYRGPEHWHFGPLSDEHRRGVGAQRAELRGPGRPGLGAPARRLRSGARRAARAVLARRPVRRPPGRARGHHRADPRPSSACPSRPPSARRLARYSFETGRTDAYRRDLDPASLKALEDVVGPTLERYGYA